MQDPALHVQHVSHRYGDRIALRDVSLSLEPGGLAALLGPNGSGKTTLAKTLNHEETIILSAESGLLSLSGVSIDAININKYKELEEAFIWLGEQTKYKNVFLDSLTEIGEILFNELKPNYERSQMFTLYDEYSTKMTKFIKALRDFHKYNIYCTALDSLTKKDFTEVVSIDLKQKSLAKRLPALFDEVFYLKTAEAEDGQLKRALMTNNEELDFLKDRSGKLDKWERPDLGAITEKIFS